MSEETQCRCGRPATECPGCGARVCEECDLAPLDFDATRRHSPLVHEELP